MPWTLSKIKYLPFSELSWFRFVSKWLKILINYVIGNQKIVGEGDENPTDTASQSANISDFAQWVQQERFPLFVKVLTYFHLLKSKSDM